MSQKIKITAVGYGVSFVELSDEELERFINEVEEVDDISEIELVSNLVSGSYYEYGFLLEEEYVFLEVDGEDEDDLIEDLLESVQPNEIDLSDTNNAHWLVYEAQEDIDCVITAEKFDSKDFDISKTKITLPNKELKVIANIYYKDESFDSFDTTSNGRVYIVKKDGEIITF